MALHLNAHAPLSFLRKRKDRRELSVFRFLDRALVPLRPVTLTGVIRTTLVILSLENPVESLPGYFE